MGNTVSSWDGWLQKFAPIDWAGASSTWPGKVSTLKVTALLCRAELPTNRTSKECESIFIVVIVVVAVVVVVGVVVLNYLLLLVQAIQFVGYTCR